MSIETIKWAELNLMHRKKESWRNSSEMKEHDKKLKEKLWHRQARQDLILQVLRHARQVSRELRTSYFFHYFISCKEKDLKDLVRQFSNFQKFNKVVRNMSEEKLKKTEGELKILEEQIKNLKKIEKLKSDIKNKDASLKIRKKKDLNKKDIEDLKNHGPFDQITEATPRLKTRNKLLNMAIG